jgi:hypothetical protein
MKWRQTWTFRDPACTVTRRHEIWIDKSRSSTASS